MAGDLLTRPTPKRPATLEVRGRVLYLADDTALVRAQLYDGLDLELSDELRARLRDQISTDEITPAYICFFYDETLGEFPYLGLRTTNAETGRRSIRSVGRACATAASRARSPASAAARAPAGNRARTRS